MSKVLLFTAVFAVPSKLFMTCGIKCVILASDRRLLICTYDHFVKRNYRQVKRMPKPAILKKPADLGCKNLQRKTQTLNFDKRVSIASFL